MYEKPVITEIIATTSMKQFVADLRTHRQVKINPMLLLLPVCALEQPRAATSRVACSHAQMQSQVRTCAELRPGAQEPGPPWDAARGALLLERLTWALGTHFHDIAQPRLAAGLFCSCLP